MASRLSAETFGKTEIRSSTTPPTMEVSDIPTTTLNGTTKDHTINTTSVTMLDNVTYSTTEHNLNHTGIHEDHESTDDEHHTDACA